MITIPTLRAELHLGAEDDLRLTRLRLRVIKQWEKETGLKWDYRESHTETVMPRGNRVQSVFLELSPVESIVKVEERGELDTEWTELTADEYLLLQPRTLRRVGCWWPELVRVQYSGGAREVDTDVQEALIVQARFLSARLNDAQIAVKSQNFEGGGGVLEEAVMHPYFKRMARLYARKA